MFEVIIRFGFLQSSSDPSIEKFSNIFFILFLLCKNISYNLCLKLLLSSTLKSWQFSVYRIKKCWSCSTFRPPSQGKTSRLC